MNPEFESIAETEGASAWEEAVNKYLPFLEDIRKRLRSIFISFIVFGLLGFVYYEQIVTFALKIFRMEGVNFAFTSPFQFINLAVSSGLALGIIAALPFMLYQVLTFLKPALSGREYRFMITLLPLAVFLFLGGFSYGVGVMKYVIGIFYENTLKLNITNILDISVFLSQIIATASLLGVAFEFPIILTALMKMNVVSYDAVTSRRSIVYFVLLLFATLLPPTDLLSLALLTVPLLLLFESTILINKLVILRKVIE